MPRARNAICAAAAFGMLGLLSACNINIGSWEMNPKSSPVKSAHAALLPNGKVLLIEGSANNPNQFAAGTFKSSVWDPASDTFTGIATPYDMFCSGHAFLANGKLLVAGGTAGYVGGYAGSRHAYEFDYQTSHYEPVPDLASGHWYPSVVSTGAGTVLAVGGNDENRQQVSKYQLFDPTANAWGTERTSATSLPYYPNLHLVADGRFFYSGVSTGGGSSPAGFWNPTANTFAPVPGLTQPGIRNQGASVLLPPAQDQKVMVIGGGSNDGPTASTNLIDLKRPAPAFVSGPPIDAPKQYLSAVILPDRTVLQTNGAGRSWAHRAEPDYPYVHSAQIYHPDTNSWESAPNSTVGRGYHSEALLLPDGRVATFGSNSSAQGSGTWEQRIEIYKPVYWDKARPVISVAPAQAKVPLGASFRFSSNKTLKWAELVRPSSSTHSSDPEQRLVDLPFTQDPTTHAVTAQISANKYLVPPGWYMLFGVGADNVPSVASWVQVTYDAAGGATASLTG